MICYQDINDLCQEAPAAVTIGKFDGLHKGHLKLLETIREKGQGCARVLLRISPEAGPSLLSEDEFEDAARQEGIDILIRCPFTPKIRTMPPDRFIREILHDRLHASFVCVGEDFRFGKHREGDSDYLKTFCQNTGIRTAIVPKVCYRGRKVSSSAVREALGDGQMELAATLLGRPYRLSGKVIHGAHLGTGMGFPTVNLIPPEGKLLPPYGVYYSIVRSEGETMTGITNLGVKPTVGSGGCVAETHLYDVSEDLYGHLIDVELLHFVRPEKKFSSLEELRRIAGRDLAKGREYFFEQGIMGRQPGADRDRSDLSGFGNGGNDIREKKDASEGEDDREDR